MPFEFVIVAGVIWVGAGLFAAVSRRRLATTIQKLGVRSVWFTATAFLVMGIVGLALGVAILVYVVVITA
jgi:hypothetical protein